MKDKKTKRETCKLCGKKLPAHEMHKKIKAKNRIYYLCCQICYEQFFGGRTRKGSNIEYF